MFILKKKKKKEKKVGIVIGSWDIEILKDYFAPLEVDLILKIPLSYNYVEGKLVWPHTANGVYSVKSGYNFLAKEKSLPSSAFSHQDDGQSVWKKLWSLSMPNKVKNFLWRASREAIPVKKNLVARKVIAEDVCDHCHVATEDVHHALWDYQELSAMWEAESMWLFRRTKKFSNFFRTGSLCVRGEQKLGSLCYLGMDNLVPPKFTSDQQQTILALSSGHFGLTDPSELYPGPTVPKNAVRC